MPQMAPYSWMFLLFMFSIIYIYFNSFLHFMKLNYKINLKKTFFTYKFSSKW